jgi:manganese oxidase
MKTTSRTNAWEGVGQHGRDLANPTVPLSSKPLPTLAIAIAAIMGSVLTVSPAYAKFNIPTDLPASPLTINGKTADPFTAKMPLFDEFGTKNYAALSSNPPLTSTLPGVTDCQSMPNGPDLDNFLGQPLHPMPTAQVDESAKSPANAWDAQVRKCVGLPSSSRTFYDGRPSGPDFAHQRYGEFPSQAYFQTAMTGARANGGLRDNSQRHNYQAGEFGPNGLYYLDVDGDKTPGTKGLPVQYHPNLPVQDPHNVWTFDGTWPPKLLQARYGETILFRHYNALPIDDAANAGFGLHTITTHEHNGHNPAESDGFAHAYFYPGQFYDYHWPMILAGHDSINTGGHDNVGTTDWAGAPDGNGGVTGVPGDWRETMSTHWFHDHMVDFTAQNVYKGNAAMMNYYSAIDRGREPATMQEALGQAPKKDGSGLAAGWGCRYANPLSANLCLPSGSGLDWGNRDYDVNLLLGDKAWDNNGQLKFNIFNTDGFLGDRMTVNGYYKPYMEVRKRRYRFRMLDASVSRIFKVAIVDSAGNRLKYHLIANDGNLMEYAIPFPNAESPDALPQQGIAERYDFVIDFSQPIVGNVYLVNIQEHQDGKGPSRVVPLADIVSGKYKADGINGDPAVGKFLEFRLKGCGSDGLQPCTDLSMNPADYEPGKTKMMVRPSFTSDEIKNAKHRTFSFVRGGSTDAKPWAISTDGGVALNADMHRTSAAPTMGSVEIWHIKAAKGWLHPVHVHFEEGQVLARDGKAPPSWEKYARKDMYRVGGPGPLPDLSSQVDMIIRVREFMGTYVEHCHNTQHEDKAMLLRWDSFFPGQVKPIPQPEQGWDGVTYDSTQSLTTPTYLIGDVNAGKNFVIPAQ